MIILMIYLIDDTQLPARTALHCAVSKGHYDCAQLLILSATDTTIRNKV